MSYKATVLQDAVEEPAAGARIDVKGRSCGIHFIDVGSPVGTIRFEGAMNAAEDSFIAVPVLDATDTIVTTATAPGYFRLPAEHGLSTLRVIVQAYTSGAFSVAAGTS